jgi:hypothetical protein
MKHIKLWENFSDSNFDFDEAFREPTEEEKLKYELEEQDRLSGEKLANKEERRKNINATGGTWQEAVQRRVKTVKDEIQNILSSHGESTIGYVKYAFEEIEDLKEMGYEAVEYANNLEIELKKIANDKLHGGKSFY